MSVSTQAVRLGPWSGYLAWPARAALPLPGVVVLQEAWGVDDHIEDVTRRFAMAGYAALAPDFYAHDGQRPVHFARERMKEMVGFVNDQPPTLFADAAARETALASLEEPRRGRLTETMNALLGNFGKVVFLEPALAAAQWLREACPQAKGQKVGAVGFCMGGAYASLLACADPKLKAAVSFYGGAPAAEKVAGIQCPVLAFYGGLDERVNAGLPGFAEAMKKHGKSLETKVYEGAKHAFFNDTRPAYDVGAARDAFARTLAFFREALA